MSVLPKPTPEKHCSYCGKKMERQRYKSKLEDLGAFMRRKYCCRECMRKGFIKSGEVTDQDIKAAHASSRNEEQCFASREELIKHISDNGNESM